MTQEWRYDENGRRTYTLPDGTVIPRTWRNVCDGIIPLEELDDEELSKMALRDKNGVVNPGPNKLVPRQLSDSRTRILLQRVKDQFSEVVMSATKVFVDVIEDPNASHADKMKAAEYLQNRFMGKTPDKIEMSAEVKPWEGLVAGVLKEVPDDSEESAS